MDRKSLFDDSETYVVEMTVVTYWPGLNRVGRSGTSTSSSDSSSSSSMEMSELVSPFVSRLVRVSDTSVIGT